MESQVIDPHSPVNPHPSDASAIPFKRLHIAASRLERLDAHTLKMMTDSSWIHLGETETDWRTRFKTELSVLNLRNCCQILYRVVKPRYTTEALKQHYAQTTFLPFNYQAGDQFDFADESFDFIYSEHFLEHLFFDEAVALLQECDRLLKPGGVVRVCVPDADLRTYAKPEPAGFPGNLVAWNHPDKHKTRWSVYSLTTAMQTAALNPYPLVYCDKDGEFFQNIPSNDVPAYKTSLDKEMINSFAYIRRPQSLIVDAIKAHS
jgi:predicted SAM-dependent methyltransferase